MTPMTVMGNCHSEITPKHNIMIEPYKITGWLTAQMKVASFEIRMGDIEEATKRLDRVSSMSLQGMMEQIKKMEEKK